MKVLLIAATVAMAATLAGCVDGRTGKLFVCGVPTKCK